MTKDEQLLQKRFHELSRLADDRNVVRFTDFLNLNELNILHTTPKTLLASSYETFGGYELAERQLVAFLPDALCYAYEYPLTVLRIAPVNVRFAEALSHRDYLGALLNLGLERAKTGDLLLHDTTAYVFVKAELADFVCRELTRVRHTQVAVSPVPLPEFSYEPRFELLKGSVPSVRLDTVLAVGFPLSRSKLTGFIAGGQVFVNGRLITSNGYSLKTGDILTLRHQGRIVYDGVLNATKKGRYMIQIKKYL